MNSVEWRRSKVQELASQGYNQSEISRILQISQPTINRELAYLRQQAKSNIKRYIDERLPEEYEKCLVGLNAIAREASSTAHQTEDGREKMFPSGVYRRRAGICSSSYTRSNINQKTATSIAITKNPSTVGH